MKKRNSLKKNVQQMEIGRYFVQQYQQTFKDWSKRDDATKEIPMETRSMWGVWKHGVEPAKSQDERGRYSGGVAPDDHFDTKEEALAYVAQCTHEDETREAEERRVAE